jgi:chromosomal replication initiator protein
MACVVDEVTEIPIKGGPVSRGSSSPSDDEVTLRAFIVGPENRLVSVAVQSLLEDEESPYRPVYFYGPPGTGKSHLALGLVSLWRASSRRRAAVYATAVDFARELADAIQTQTTEDFSTPYRRASLLVLEDVDLLAGKQAAQRELVVTLDALNNRGSRTVLTGKNAPGQLEGISHRLRSRLAAGLAVPLAPPGPSARLAILERLARAKGLQLADPAARTLADGLTLTVPGLLGALAQLQAEAPGGNRMIDLEAARQYLARRNGAGHVSLPQIARMTARHFSLKVTDLQSPSRRHAVVAARGVAMYLARNLTAESLEQIGHYFGGRDHTTVSYGCRKTEERLQTEPDLRDAVFQLREKLIDRIALPEGA